MCVCIYIYIYIIFEAATTAAPEIRAACSAAEQFICVESIWRAAVWHAIRQVTGSTMARRRSRHKH